LAHTFLAARTPRDDADVPTLRAANLALKFLLELGAMAAFAYWGASTGDGAVPFVLAIVAPVGTVALWAVFAAPRSERRLPLAARVPFELGVFALAVLALLAAGSPVAAIVYAALVVVNAALMTVFHQWEL
jgi:hypothetical protein